MSQFSFRNMAWKEPEVSSKTPNPPTSLIVNFLSIYLQPLLLKYLWVSQILFPLQLFFFFATDELENFYQSQGPYIIFLFSVFLHALIKLASDFCLFSQHFVTCCKLSTYGNTTIFCLSPSLSKNSAPRTTPDLVTAGVKFE